MTLRNLVLIGISVLLFSNSIAQPQIFAGYISASIERKNEFVVALKLVSTDTLPASVSLELVSQSFTPLKKFVAPKKSQSLSDTGSFWFTEFSTSFNLSPLPFVGNMPYHLGFRFSEPMMRDFFLEAQILTSPVVGSYKPLNFKLKQLIGNRKPNELGSIDVYAHANDSLSFELVKPTVDFGKAAPDYFFPDDPSLCAGCSFKVNPNGRFEVSGQFSPGIYKLYVSVKRWIKIESTPILIGNSISILTYSFKE